MTLIAPDLPVLLGGRPLVDEPMPLVRPYLPDQAALVAKLAAVLETGMLTNSRRVRELETAVAARLGVEHVVAVASCTSGLALVLQALGARGPVLLPSFTFSASAHAVVWAGGQPRFADVLEDSLTLDPADAERCLDGAVAMTATHVYGTPCEVDRLEELSRSAGIPLVFDAAHALGSERRGVPIGGFGAAEVFSLSPTKVTVAGEGGLVATRDADLAEAIRLGRDYGNPGNYDCRFPGLNARMSELHATIALHCLAHLNASLVRRHELVQRFWKALPPRNGVRGPSLGEGDVSTYKDLTVVVDQEQTGLSAKELGRALAAEGIDSRHYYDPPIHRQHAYRDLPSRPLPVTDRVAGQVLSPPLWSQMTDGQVEMVARSVDRILAHAGRVRSALAREAA
ncbi:MAG: DegT/DnrJ/EryC1/StrS family aminotransferase [Actinomycetota bacterium]|nr:DegT/DnrJ/EryC1/StrS family aminotransferase [Actinomycetota bacterium]